LTVNV